MTKADMTASPKNGYAVVVIMGRFVISDLIAGVFAPMPRKMHHQGICVSLSVRINNGNAVCRLRPEAPVLRVLTRTVIAASNYRLAVPL